MTKNGSTLSLSLANPPSTTEKWSNIGTGVRHFPPSNFERTIPQGDHTTNFDNRSFGYPPIGVHSTPTAHAEVQPNTLSTAVGKGKTFEGLASDSAKTLGFTEGDTNVVVDDMSGQKSYDRYRRRNAQPAIPPIPLSPAEAGLMSENERSMERNNSNNPFLPENIRRGVQHQHPHRYQYPQPGSFGHEDWYYITPHDGNGSDKSTQLGEIELDGHPNDNIQTYEYSKVGTFPSTENGKDNLAITDEHPGAVHLRQPTYVSGLESEIDNLRTKLSSLTEDYDKMCDRKEHYKGEYHQTHTDLTKSNERIEHLRKGAREFREMYEQACEISQRNYTSWSESQSNVLHLNGKIRSLLSDQETMQNRIERLESDKVRLYADNHALRSEMKGLDEQISTYRDGSYQDGLRIAEEKKYSESLQTKVRELEDYIYRNRSGLRDRSQIQREGYERSMYGKGEDEKDYRYEVREPTQAQHDQADQADRSD
ncbi:hypothetical protein V865_006444 [Kwoniella europaea PYCC6329]|uniref:Uncharacterized protein n=1 Tax=Kwoniella europaea PYCC6329 TaxID=1423913 RepID=A0AAX4KSS0_9TREE